MSETDTDLILAKYVAQIAMVMSRHIQSGAPLEGEALVRMRDGLVLAAEQLRDQEAELKETRLFIERAMHQDHGGRVQ